MTDGKKDRLYIVLQWTILFVAISYFLFPYTTKYSFEFFGLSFFLTQPLMLASLVLFSCALFFSPQLMLHLRNLLNNWRIYSLFFSSLLVIILSTLVHLGVTTVSVSRAVSIIVIMVVTLLFSLLSRKFIYYFFVISAYFTMVASVLGILQFFVSGAFSPEVYFGSGFTEIYAVGFTNLSSLFGLHLSLFCVIFWLFFIDNYNGKREIWGMAFLLGIPALVLTFSRGAWLAVVVVGLVALVWILRKKYNKKYILLSLLAALFFASITLVAARYIAVDRGEVHNMPADFSKELVARRFRVSSDKSASSRVMFHRSAIELIAGSPGNLLVGFGVWGFYDNWPQFDPEARIRENIDPHSTFLEILTAGGLVGFLLFLGFLVALYRLVLRRCGDDIVAMALLAGFSIVLINGLTHTHLYTKYMWIIAGLLLAVLAVHAHGKEKIETSL